MLSNDNAFHWLLKYYAQNFKKKLCEFAPNFNIVFEEKSEWEVSQYIYVILSELTSIVFIMRFIVHLFAFSAIFPGERVEYENLLTYLIRIIMIGRA